MWAYYPSILHQIFVSFGSSWGLSMQTRLWVCSQFSPSLTNAKDWIETVCQKISNPIRHLPSRWNPLLKCVPKMHQIAAALRLQWLCKFPNVKDTTLQFEAVQLGAVELIKPFHTGILGNGSAGYGAGGHLLWGWEAFLIWADLSRSSACSVLQHSVLSLTSLFPCVCVCDTLFVCVCVCVCVCVFVYMCVCVTASR